MGLGDFDMIFMDASDPNCTAYVEVISEGGVLALGGVMVLPCLLALLPCPPCLLLCGEIIHFLLPSIGLCNFGGVCGGTVGDHEFVPRLCEQACGWWLQRECIPLAG